MSTATHLSPGTLLAWHRHLVTVPAVRRGAPSRARYWAIVRRVELARAGRLLLRRWEEHDLPAFLDLYSRDDVTRWLGPHPRRALAGLTLRQFRYPAGA
jgi:hypothetical protein